MNVDAHHYVNHGNICIQYCELEVVQSEYPDKNTKVKQ